MYGKKSASFLHNTKLDLLSLGRNSFKDISEDLQFQAVVRLATYFEFGKQDELWSTVGRKYIPDVEFGKTGMGCDRLKEIFSAHRY